VLTPLVLALAVLGAAWGFIADRIAARWPEHEDGSVRRIDWRTPVAVVVGALALGAVPVRFEDDAVASVVFGAYVVALVLLLATDLDQRLLPDVITLPAIPLAFVVTLAGINPLVPPGQLPIAIVVALAVPAGLALLARPFGAGAIGMGDLKLLVSVGLLAGPLRMFTGVVYGALLAGIVILVLLAVRRITLKTFIPFGPFLIIGALWVILALP
jgi:leader peptidase (prepilin peptidase) / N-methyltransferase